MDKKEYIKSINKFSLDSETDKIVYLLNIILNEENYHDNLDLIFIMISMTQMYGFLQYLSRNEKEKFLAWDQIRSNSYSGYNIEYLNSGQLSILCEFKKTKKVFLSAPTSFGKTSLVIEHIIRNYLLLNNIMFIVPTNSLLEEIFTKLMIINKRYSMHYKITTQPFLDNNLNNILVLTPERFLILSEKVNVNKFDLIIMDEAYKIVDSHNNKVSEFINSRSLRFRKVADLIGETDKKLILLSPFTYEDSDSMKRYFKKYGIEKSNRKIEYVNREIIKMYTKDAYNIIFGEDFVKYQESYSIANKVCILLNKLKNEKNIVYVANYNSAYKIVNEMKNENFQSKDERYLAFLSHLEANYNVNQEGCEWSIIKAIKRGVGIYISPLPRYIKREIISLFERNILNTLIVTTAFTEGVNTNASNLIFTSLINGPNKNRLNDIDILNIEGRAGRFAKNSVGKVYCIKKDVYDKVIYTQKNANILLQNYNYIKNENNESKLQYELDMVDDEYLTIEEKYRKNEIQKMISRLNLTNAELNISLNVPNEWKIILYKYFKEMELAQIEKIYSTSVRILDKDSHNRKEALKEIFDSIEEAFKDYEIDPFKCEKYDIRAYSTSIRHDFIWGRLYGLYTAGKFSKIIERNIIYIKNEFNKVCERHHFIANISDKKHIEPIFDDEHLRWILKYFNKDLSLNFNSFYSETFKFISNIVQYKIPFYTSYYVSILKLFISKNMMNQDFDLEKLDSQKVSLFFEEGDKNGEYSQLIDYGMSNDVILDLEEHNITLEDVKTGNYNKEIFDRYELIVINDFLKII